MTVRRWIHLATLLVPVGILTVFNILGIEAGAPLLAALSALTTGGVAVGPGQSGQRALAESRPAAKRPRRASPKRKVPNEGAYSQSNTAPTVVASESEPNSASAADAS